MLPAIPRAVPTYEAGDLLNHRSPVLKGRCQCEQNFDVPHVAQNRALRGNLIVAQGLGELPGVALRVNQAVIGSGKQQGRRAGGTGVDQRLGVDRRLRVIENRLHIGIDDRQKVIGPGETDPATEHLGGKLFLCQPARI